MKTSKPLMTLMCLAMLALVPACTANPPEQGTNTGNNTETPGENNSNGNCCWKITVTIPTDLYGDMTVTSYTWASESTIKWLADMEKNAYGEEGTTVTYEKTAAGDKDGCESTETIDEYRQYKYDDLFKLERLEPGIYLRDKSQLFAKSTDGGMFYINNVNWMMTAGTKECIPQDWRGFDGKNTTYQFTVKVHNDIDNNWMTHTYKDTVFYKNVSVWDDARLTQCYKEAKLSEAFNTIGTVEKIDDAGDFDETYVTIAKRYQRNASIVPPSKQLLCYTEYGCKYWLSDYYPDDMDAKRYVIPYKGSGQIDKMSISRIFDWGATIDDPHVAWLPGCLIDDVSDINVEIINVSSEDAAAYIKYIRENGIYTNLVKDGPTEFEANSNNYYDENVHGPAPEGLKQYVYPSYIVSYSGGVLKIKFSVTYTIFV